MVVEVVECKNTKALKLRKCQLRLSLSVRSVVAFVATALSKPVWRDGVGRNKQSYSNTLFLLHMWCKNAEPRLDGDL